MQRAPDEDSFANYWQIPGGHVDRGETVYQAVVRETYEETELEVDKVLRRLVDLHWDSKSGTQHNIQYNFAVSINEPFNIRLSPTEHSQWKWVSINTIDALLISNGMKSIVRDALGFAENQRDREGMNVKAVGVKPGW
jgi:8-oxo-dGTP diphosphatase